VLSNNLTVQNRVNPLGAYSVTHWEGVARMCQDSTASSGQSQRQDMSQGSRGQGGLPLPSLKALGAGVSSSLPLPPPPLSSSPAPALVPAQATPPLSLLLQSTAGVGVGVETRLALRSPASCFAQSQQLVMNLFRSLVRVRGGRREEGAGSREQGGSR
jgi:hypothetical protein